mmetsp:Transcript_8899/g.20590  ORF Transcript_8899/g.20590 Transcript_8899/m.20590 type:complete len:84 (+) Transcript_8899:260-511(+)
MPSRSKAECKPPPAVVPHKTIAPVLESPTLPLPFKFGVEIPSTYHLISRKSLDYSGGYPICFGLCQILNEMMATENKRIAQLL